MASADIKITDQNDSTNFQFINMDWTPPPPGTLSVNGGWRGFPVLLASAGGTFEWDGSPSTQVTFFFDGASGSAVLGCDGWMVWPPTRGMKGTGSVFFGANNSIFDIFWEVT